MTTDLTTFLRARHDERERVAKQARPTYDDGELPDAESLWNAQIHTRECGYRMGALQHACCCDAGQIELADIAAKRRIIDEHPTIPEDWAWEAAGDCRTCNDPAPCKTVRLLAQPHAGHPDFNPDWAV